MASKDSKDVKAVTQSAVLSPSVRASAAAPLSRSGKPKKRIVIEDYVSIDGDCPPSDDDKSSTGGGAESSVGARKGSVEARKGGVETPPRDSVLAPVALSDTELEQYILREIAATRGGRHEGTLAECKHLYHVYGSTNFTASGTESALPVADIAGGTTVSSRLTNTVRLRRLRFKFLFFRSGGASTQATVVMPVIHCVIFRDKTPAVVGTPPGVHATDSLPPTSATAIFSRLGATQSQDADRTMVRNPVTEDLYHVYEYRQFHFNSEQSSITATSMFSPTEYVRHEIDLDLHDVQQIYAGSGSSSVTNPIYVVLWSDYVQDTLNGFTHGYRVVSDLEFHDVQDD